MVELGLLLGGRLGNTGRAREKAVEMVEAAVLRIDHDDRLDPGERVVGPGRAGEREDCSANQPKQSDPHLPPPAPLGSAIILHRFGDHLMTRLRVGRPQFACRGLAGDGGRDWLRLRARYFGRS